MSGGSDDVEVMVRKVLQQP